MQPIEVFFRRVCVVDMWHRFVVHLDISFVGVVVGTKLEHTSYVRGGGRGRCEQPAIGESAMGLDDAFVGRTSVCRKKSGRVTMSRSDDEGCIVEAVCMVVHEVAVEEKGVLTDMGQKLVPFFVHGRMVGRDDEICHVWMECTLGVGR